MAAVNKKTVRDLKKELRNTKKQLRLAQAFIRAVVDAPPSCHHDSALFKIEPADPIKDSYAYRT
jgi:hypothetical protein